MPATSIAQRRAIAIAEHAPSKLYKRNASLLGMKHSDMHDFASTSESGLPAHVHALARSLKKKKLKRYRSK